MIFGINQNLSLIGREFHVQTEVITGGKELIRTTVYVGGRIIGQRESELPAFPDSEDEIRELMRAQHDMIIGNMVRRMEEVVAAKTPAKPVEAVNEPPPEPVDGLGLPAHDSSARLLNSVQVRQLLAPFWDIGKQSEPANPEKLRGRLTRLAELITGIVSSPVFPSLRVEEQVRFNILIDRIQAWFEKAADNETGFQLWSQVALFSLHIGKINNRRELITYDRQMLQWARTTITAEGITPQVLEQLDRVRGRDLELDCLLTQPDSHDQHHWLNTLQRILNSL